MRFQPKIDNRIWCRKRNSREIGINIGYSVYYALKNLMKLFKISLIRRQYHIFVERCLPSFQLIVFFPALVGTFYGSPSVIFLYGVLEGDNKDF